MDSSQAQYRAATVAGILLRSASQARDGPPRSCRRDLLCPLVAVGVELVGRPPAGPGSGCDDLGATLCGVSGECSLSGMRHSGGVDCPAGWAETRVARGVVAHAPPSARGRPPPLLRARLGRSGIAYPVVGSPDRAAGLASGIPDQPRPAL